MSITKKSNLLAGAAIAALLLGGAGCSNEKKTDTAAQSQKYKILSGSTADSRGRGGQQEDDKFGAMSEPALNPDTRFAAGQLAEAQGQVDCATVQYEQALRLNKNHVPSLYRMGVVYTKLRAYDKAIAMWERYIDATGGIASGYSNLGFCYEMAGDPLQAEVAYQKGLEIDPKNEACRVNYGLMLARNNRQPEAQEQLGMVLPPEEVAYNLASIYEQQGAVAQAKDELKKALEVNPNMTEAQTKLATLPQD